MKLSDIKPLTEEMSIPGLKAELTKAYDEKKMMMMKGASLGHGGVKPEYIPRIDKIKANIKAIQDQLKLLQQQDKDGNKESVAAIKKELSTRNDDKDAVASRKSAAQSAGNNAANAFVKKHGGYTGVAKYLGKKMKAMTNDGTEALDAQVLADEVGITKGSITRWLRRPEFKDLARYTKGK